MARQARSARLGDELRAALGIARKDLRILFRYPLETVNVVLAPLYQFLLPSLLLGSTFLVGGRAVGLERSAGTADTAGFLLLGMIVSFLVFTAFWGIGFSFKKEMDQGTLEPAWLTPTSRETLVVGRALSALLTSVIGSAIVLFLAVTVFGARISPEAVLAVPALVLAAVGILGVSFLISSVVLLLKEPTFFVDSTDFLFNAASGVGFPVAVLPGALKLVSFALPTTYALDVLRVHALGSTPLVPEPVAYLALVALAAIFLTLGRLCFRWTERRLQQQGTIGQH